jgi:hypothetical protein
MTTDDPAASPSAQDVARILHDPPTTSPPARTLVADELPTRVRTKPITIELGCPRRALHRLKAVKARPAWVPAAWVLAAVVMVAVLMSLLPRGGSSAGPGQQAPTTSPGPDRLRQDLQNLQSAVQP